MTMMAEDGLACAVLSVGGVRDTGASVDILIRIWPAIRTVGSTRILCSVRVPSLHYLGHEVHQVHSSPSAGTVPRHPNVKKKARGNSDACAQE